MDYWVLAFYILKPLDDPHDEIEKHKQFFSVRDLKGRIYISEEGINAQMSGSPEHAGEYMDWLRSDDRFRETVFKIHYWPEHAFPKATIKYRKQLVALDSQVDLAKQGEYVAAKRWTEMLRQSDENTIVLDTRNDYEWKVGHFKGADLPPLEAFREFPKYVKKLKQ